VSTDTTHAPGVAAGSATAKWLARDHEALAGVLPRYYDVVAERGEGSWLVDVDGRRFLDLGAGIAVNTTGHCHPRVVEAISDQARTLLHTSVVVHQTRNIALAERIGALCPFLDEPQVFFCNSGAEAVDGALKLARRLTGRPGIIAFRRAFHGRTLAATSLTTAKGRYREGYEPLLPGVYHAPYCVPHEHATPEAAVDAALAELDGLMTLVAPPGNVGAMIVEPVLGEGGYVPPPRAWLEGLRARCDEHGIVLVFDEVQCGVGRTGKWWAIEHFGVEPDIVTIAKGIASGVPLGACLARQSVMDWERGAHGNTFGGNPIACAAALATLDLIQHGYMANAAQVGQYTLDALEEIKARHPSIGDVRGKGLMIGVEFVLDRKTKEPAKELCERVMELSFERGLLTLSCGKSVMRIAPALSIKTAEVDEGLQIFEQAIALAEQESGL
jgi:4-aminobutyrate aminotransferase